MTKQQIGKILKNLRLKANLTQKQVASSIGRTQQIIGHWETGYSQPDADTLFTLCDLYGASVDEAFGYTKKSPAPTEIGTREYTDKEKSILSDFKKLNQTGRRAACAVVKGFTSLPEYTESQNEDVG